MKYNQLDLKKFIDNIDNFENWPLLKEKINKKTGFILPQQEEIDVIKATYSDKVLLGMSFNNLLNAEYIENIESKERISDIKIISKIIGKHRIMIDIDGKQYTPSSLYAYFICPSCLKKYSVHLNPSRGLLKDCSLCRWCQKKILHKCADYRKNYEEAMIQKYGVSSPIQNKEIHETFCNTMLERYGVPYSGMSPELLKKSQDTLYKRIGKRNFFEGTNFWRDLLKEKVPAKTSCLEKIIVDHLDEIFAGYKTLSYKNRNFITTINGKTYNLDFYVKELNLIIEVYGDYWHCNPELYENNFKCLKGKAADIWEYDTEREEALRRKFGSEYFVIWETDWLTDKNAILSFVRSMFLP